MLKDPLAFHLDLHTAATLPNRPAGPSQAAAQNGLVRPPAVCPGQGQGVCLAACA